MSHAEDATVCAQAHRETPSTVPLRGRGAVAWVRWRTDWMPGFTQDVGTSTGLSERAGIHRGTSGEHGMSTVAFIAPGDDGTASWP